MNGTAADGKLLVEAHVHPENFDPGRWPVDGGIELCTLNDEPGGTWLFFRQGPWHTTGASATGETWSRTMFEFGRDVMARFEDRNGEVIIGDHILGSSRLDGDLIGDPPLHQHHFHFYYETNSWRQALNVHGDSDCFYPAGSVPDSPGIYCLMREYPEGVGFHARPLLGVMADVIDARPRDSPVLPWYTLAGVRLLTPSHFDEAMPRPVRMSYVNLHPAIGLAQATDMRYYFTTFYAHAGRVVWNTGVMPDIDYIVDAYWHTHRQMAEDIWLMTGEPGPLGLWEPPWVNAFSRTLGPSEGHRDVAKSYTEAESAPFFGALKAQLTKRIKQSGATLLCRYAESKAFEAPPYVYPNSSASTDFMGGKVTCPLHKHKLRGYVRWTAVAFFQRQHADVVSPYPMHSLLRVYHTTVGNMRDDNLAWRNPPCKTDVLVWRKQVDHNCGEEFYSGFDADFLLSIPFYPYQALWGIQQLEFFGLAKVLQVFCGKELGLALYAHYQLTLCGVLLLLVLLCVGGCRLCRRLCCCPRRVAPPDAMVLAKAAAREEVVVAVEGSETVGLMNSTQVL